MFRISIVAYDLICGMSDIGETKHISFKCIFNHFFPAYKMEKPVIIISQVAIILTALVSFIAAQSTSFSPTPSIQQTFAVSNQTEMLNASMTTMTTVQHQITSVHVQPSSTEVSRPNSKIMSTPPSSTAKVNEEDKIEEDEDKKKETAIIAASCGGAAVVFIGLTLVIWNHRKEGNT